MSEKLDIMEQCLGVVLKIDPVMFFQVVSASDIEIVLIQVRVEP